MNTFKGKRQFPSTKLGALTAALVALGLGTLVSAQGTPGKTTITMLVLPDWEANMRQVVRQFNVGEPNIEVRLEVLPFDQLFQQVQVRLSSGTASPDVVPVDAPVLAAYAVQNFLAPLDAVFTKSELAQFVPASLQTSSYGGHLLATPMENSSQVLYYNKDLLQKAGIPLPSADPRKRLTWEQLAGYAQKATVRSNGQVASWGFVIDQVDRPYQLLPLAQSLGGQAIGKDGLTTRGIINSPQWVKAFTFYSNLFNTWKVTPQSTSIPGNELFASGRAAFFWGGPWNVKGVLKDRKGLNYGIAPTPYFAGGKAVTPNDSWHLGVNRNSKNFAAAARFIRYMSLGRGQDEWFRLSGNAPVLRRTAQLIARDPAYAKFPNTVYRLSATEAGSTAVPRPVTPGYTEYQDVLAQAFANIRTGQAPKAALDRAAEQIDRAMTKYRR